LYFSKNFTLETSLPPFTFTQVGVRWGEFQAVPGPEARALHAKTKAASISWTGRASFSFPCEPVDSDVGAPTWAPDSPASFCGRTGESSGWVSFPADAFCAQRPCLWATRLLMSRKRIHQSEWGQVETRH
jgi:hypothetical protein